MKLLDIMKSGRMQFGSVRVTIDTGGIGGRYRAFVITPYYNTMIETPDTANIEGILSFYERLAPALYEILLREGEITDDML